MANHNESLPNNTIIQGDCVSGLAQLPEGCVDLAFADPPFNIGYDYDVYEDRHAAEDYLTWCGQWIAGMRRIDDGCVDLAFADPPFNIGYDYDVYDDRKAAEHYLDWCK
ncbi:MAG TPA: DNA methyltransferase, partial [Pirellulales bacterium]